MIQHQFIFHPGRWIGEGRITFTASPEFLRFYTRWNINDATPLGIACTQEVEMIGVSHNMHNRFMFSHITPASFEIELENELLGTVIGKGLIEPKTIAWEFHGRNGLEGFEVYELQDNGDYMMHAEYASADQFRTIIDGLIWMKVSTE